MNIDTPSRLRTNGRRAALAALALCALTLPLAAGWNDENQPLYPYPNEAAALVDPYDQVPEIDFSHCRWSECRFPGRERRQPPPPVLPGSSGHATFLVDCGMRRSEPRRGLFNSVNEAAEFAPPNATILILPPGEGTTCVETVRVRGPLTIATYGGGNDAVIQAPQREPCMVAHIPLGDALIVNGVRFIARSREAPCISVEAGHVVMRNSSVNSRGSDWAFDVHESGELTVESTRIETDASGIHARRAHVELRNLDIDIDGRNGAALLNLGRTDCTDRDGGTIRGSVGLALECSEGYVEGGNIIGGAVGVLASAGTRGLRLTDVKIAKADTGILLLPGQLGTVNVERPVLSRTRDGIIVAPGAESQITGGVITDSSMSGITVYGAGTLVSGNKIVGGEDGIRMFAGDAFPPPIFPDFAAVPVIGAERDGPIVENNLVANVWHAAVLIDGRFGGRLHRLHGRLMGNTFYARHPAVCIDDEYNDDPVRVRANTCNSGWLPWPF
jgi:hypothetical protein